MKKLLVIGLTIFGFTVTKAQDDSDKKFRFGLKAMPEICWLKADDATRFAKGGAVMKFGYGVITEFHLAGAAWFSTGFQVNYTGGKIKYVDSTYYYYSTANSFQDVKKLDFNDPNSYNKYTLYGLDKRTFKSTYLTIPLLLRLKTQEIGYLTYFGNIGVLSSIHLKTKADDEVRKYDFSSGSTVITSTKNEDLNISKDMQFARFSLQLGGGVEMNLSGSTSFIIGLNYLQGFSNAVQKDSQYNLDGPKSNGNAKPTSLTQKFVGSGLSLMVGVLF